MHLRLTFWAIIAFLAPLRSTAQTQTPAPVIVEATSSMHGIGGYEQKQLLVRLTDDGKVQWETTQWQKPNELHSTRIDPELVSAIRLRLDEIDPAAIQAKMGPYNRYVDTSVELFIRVDTLKWKREFTVLNPWPHWPLKPRPKELKAVICDIDRLHAQVAEESVEPMCAKASADQTQESQQ
jgi:hypothetical protein